MIAAENPLSLSLLLPPLIPNSTLTTPQHQPNFDRHQPH